MPPALKQQPWGVRVPLQPVLGSPALCGRNDNARHMRLCAQGSSSPTCRAFRLRFPFQLLAVATARYVMIGGRGATPTVGNRKQVGLARHEGLPCGLPTSAAPPYLPSCGLLGPPIHCGSGAGQVGSLNPLGAARKEGLGAGPPALSAMFACTCIRCASTCTSATEVQRY